MSAYPELSRRMAPVCAEAVDDMEVAAVLESDGVTDATADRLYGSPDVFHLARRLRADHPRRPSAVPPAPGPWRAQPWRHLLRGVLFGLPAVCYLAVSGVAAGRRAGVVLVVSVLLSWAASQALAYLGHVRLGWGDRDGAARVLRGGLLGLGAAVLAATAATAAALHVPAPVTLVAAAQVTYLLAATVALVLGAEWLLVAALAPGVGAAVTGVLLGGDAVRSAPVVCGAVGTVLASVAAALWVTRGARPGPPTRAELRDALPHAAFGLCVAGLLLFVPAARTLPPPGVVDGGPGGAAAGLAALVPLSVSMGVAEWLLVRYRADTHRWLQRAVTLRQFAARASLALARGTAVYLAVLVAGVAAGALLVTRAAPAALAGYVALGAALFVALLLMTFRVRGPVVAGAAAALAADAALLTAHPDPDRVQLITAGALFLGLAAYASVALSRAHRHL
ncbi:hypothetical protein [Spirilliplanes yamanashiensis]|uniref:Uncharacterized protein n=1 Tax=Spirilliplanes yamanashiensis TaxID=42233 RepID=A0A8J3Y5S8_9ACTN|nr:hypothetical protein [Spirilliplanes yamanashiensis]MDP9814719.1 hypothetical protein [Spirilliplanes yamanashiensis]GIJ02371.1 hypothetical protein Sya03_17230 [Spirilliplanes yamanashiensis]